MILCYVGVLYQDSRMNVIYFCVRVMTGPEGSGQKEQSRKIYSDELSFKNN